MPDRDSLIDAEYEPEDDQFGRNRADPWEKSIYQGECEREAVEDRPAFCWWCCRLMTDPHCCEFCRPLKRDRSLREERP